MIGQIRIDPHSYLPSFADEDHLLAYIEISNILVQNFKTF
jgi:hypothetical protein